MLKPIWNHWWSLGVFIVSVFFSVSLPENAEAPRRCAGHWEIQSLDPRSVPCEGVTGHESCSYCVTLPLIDNLWQLETSINFNSLRTVLDLVGDPSRWYCSSYRYSLEIEGHVELRFGWGAWARLKVVPWMQHGSNFRFMASKTIHLTLILLSNMISYIKCVYYTYIYMYVTI